MALTVDLIKCDKCYTWYLDKHECIDYEKLSREIIKNYPIVISRK